MKFLLGLLLTLLLMASLARADQAPYTLIWTSIDPDAGVELSHDLGVNQVNNAMFYIPLPLDGGIMEYGFRMFVAFDNSVPVGVGVNGGCTRQVIQYPPGFVFDPNKAPIDQWPFDLCFSPIGDGVSDPAMFRETASGYVFVPGVYGDVTITGATPEPGSMEFILIGLLVSVLVRGMQVHAGVHKR